MTYQSQRDAGSSPGSGAASSPRSSAGPKPRPDDAGQRIARLCHVLKLVEKIAGRPPAPRGALDNHARITSAYGHASPIVQRRFDALIAETAAWVAAGVEALLVAGDAPARAAAEQLARELDRTLDALANMLGITREPRPV
ncbi:hypothetical protein [Sphingomonas sp.]|uniref:hypothetical protein n=1 Tax=Sphingomonas sp. TaxID=28214 RepID=UPI002FC8E20B